MIRLAKTKYISILYVTLILETIFLFVMNGKTTITSSLVLSFIPIVIIAIVNYKRKTEKTQFLLVMALLTVIIFLPYITKYKVFYFSNDQYIQYDYFENEWNRLVIAFIKDRSLPFYSFNNFLGNNYFSSKSYYLTGDILYPLTRLFNNVNEGFLFETMVIVVLSGVFFYLYLEKFDIKNKKIIKAISIIYAFSGIAAFYTGQYFWHRFYALLPLLLFSVEDYRINNRCTLFSIVVCICLLTNYYFMFPTSIFLVFYYIFTFYYHQKTLIRVILKKSCKLVIAYIIGLLLSGILIFPTIMNIVNNSRVGSGLDLSLAFDFKFYIGYFYNLIIAPFSLGAYHNNFDLGGNGHLTQYTVYAGCIAAPIILSSFILKINNQRMKSIRIFTILISVLFFIPFTNSIMHGFSGSSARWAFLCVIVYLLNIAIFFDEKESINEYKKGMIIYLIILVVITIYAIITKLMIIDLENTQFINAIISICLMFIYFYFFKTNRINTVLVICCLEILLSFNYYLLNTSSQFKNYEKSLDTNSLSYINEQEEDKFYRIAIDYHNLSPFLKELNLNQSLNYGYKSFDSYDSTYEANLKEFLEMNGIENHIMQITNPEVKKMLGVRYCYVLDESELPKGYEFSYVTNNNNFKIYKLNNYRPIGFTYSLFTNNKEDIVKNNSWNNVLLIPEYMKEKVKDISDGENYNFELKEYYDDNNLKGNIYLDNKRILFFSIPYNDGWRIKDNGTYIEKHKVQGGFIGVVLEPGEHYIELNFVPPGFKAGCVASLLGLIGEVVLIVFDKRKKY